jgi:uncharacterized protein
MAITGWTDKHQFGSRLDQVLSPAHPIQSIEHLLGRGAELQRIEQALFATGRHVFVYGDRGVGKSSLAATAAVQYQSVDAGPIFAGGSSDDTFRSVIANVASKAISRSRVDSVKASTNTGLEWRGLRFGESVEVTPLDISTRIGSISDAAELLAEVAKRHSSKPVVVIDEFDAISSADERNKFAHLLKHLGDQGTNIKFIFTGIATSLQELLGAHLSSHRQLEQVELDRLPWESRRAIVENAADAFGLEIDDNVNWRIAMISDGYPYYVHLITERMLWSAWNEDELITTLGTPHFLMGLRNAIASINAELRRPYEDAVLQREEHYEDVVWSTADGDEMLLSLHNMYEAYRVIQQKRDARPALERPRFSDCVRDLRKPGFGAILQSLPKRAGWYTYREPMLRGYVRMQAEANGVQLLGEKPPPRARMHIPANARTGVRGPSIPAGVRQNISLTKEGK